MEVFFQHLNKVRFHECVEVKGKVLTDGESRGYQDPTNMSRFSFDFFPFYVID